MRRRKFEFDFFPIDESGDVLRRRHQLVVLLVCDVGPPVLLLVVGEERAVHRVGDPALALKDLLTPGRNSNKKLVLVKPLRANYVGIMSQLATASEGGLSPSNPN